MQFILCLFFAVTVLKAFLPISSICREKEQLFLPHRHLPLTRCQTMSDFKTDVFFKGNEVFKNILVKSLVEFRQMYKNEPSVGCEESARERIAYSQVGLIHIFFISKQPIFRLIWEVPLFDADHPPPFNYWMTVVTNELIYSIITDKTITILIINSRKKY